MRGRLARLAPLAAVCAAGCFATRNDVRLLQADVARMQSTVIAQMAAAQQAEMERERRADSVRAEEMKRLLAVMNIVSESLIVISDRASRDGARDNESFNRIVDQISSLGQVLSANSKQMRDALAQADARRAEASSGSGKPDSTTGSAEPGPARLYTIGKEQLAKGSGNAARVALGELLTKYPTSPYAAHAQLMMGEAFARDADEGAADSVYALVATKYPTSPYASLALYKRGVALQAAQPRRAREMFQKILDDYPGSDEAPLARDRIAKIPPA